jgi:hypothetical protein
MLEIVSERLERLDEPVAYVGGATVGLYLDEAFVAGVRGTDDVDCVVEIAAYADMARLEKKLRQLRLRHDTSPDAPVCRWRCGANDIKLDIMPMVEEVFGFANRWYQKGMRQTQDVALPSGRQIRIFSSPLFLASKLEAFDNRGHGDFMASRDIEDVIAVLDGRTGVVGEVRQAEPEVRQFLAERAATLLSGGGAIDDALIGHLPHQGALVEERFRRLRGILEEVVTAS